MNRIDQILRSRGHEPKQETGEGYQGFTDSGGHPQMGFVLMRANGAMDAFFYHNLDNLDLRVIRGTHYLNFTHRGKAVTLQGARLDALLHAIMGHTLTGIYEYDGDGSELADDMTVITRVAVTIVNLAQDSLNTEAEEQVSRMQTN